MKKRFLQALLGLMGGLGGAFLLRVGIGDWAFSREGTVWATEAPSPPSPSLPPLEVDSDAPLLLDEPTEPSPTLPSPTPRAAAENAPCEVCHANFQKEPLVSWHAAGDVACVDCYGKSYAHRNDENNTTPPEVMYPADQIDPACQKCHPTHDVPARQVIARWLHIRPPKTDPQTIVCTDCHGTHRCRHRSVRWDKKTGRLLPREPQKEAESKEAGQQVGP